MAKMTTRRKLAIATWKAPNEGNIYGKLTVNATKAKTYLAHLRETTGEKITITHLVGRAIAEALGSAPGLNGRIAFGKFIPHETVDLSFLVALEDGKDLAKVKVEEANKKSVADIAAALRDGSQKLRSGKDEAFEKSKGPLRLLPTFMIRWMVWFVGILTGVLGIDAKALGLERFPFGASIITSVGMFGLDEAWVPPTPWARVPLYILVGAERERPASVDGVIVSQPQFTLTATIDHRFVDGFEASKLALVTKRMLEDPWTYLEAGSESAESEAA